MYRGVQKTLDWGVKIASLAVTAPATWIVATQLFYDVQSDVLLFIMRFAAVFLVEGVLLSNWLLLEFDKNATPEIKVRYGVTALTMYVALLVIAWRHEGPTGIVFRVALLAALIGSGWDTYVYTWHRITANVDRSPENSGKVKRHARNLSIKESIYRREAEHASTVALIEAQGQADLAHASLYGQRLLADVNLQHKAETLRQIEADEQLDNHANGKKKRLQALPSVSAVSGLRSPIFPAGQSLDGLPLRQSILGALAEDPNYTPANLSEKLGARAEVIASEMNSLVEDGLLRREGRGHYIVEGAEFRNNGKRLKGKPLSRIR